MGSRPPRAVTAIIPTKDPDEGHLRWTLQSLCEQSHPPEEVLIVDSSDPPLQVEEATGPFPVRVVHRPGLGLGEARRVGMREAQTPLVIHLDEDAVLLNQDHLRRAAQDVERRGISAVGGVVRPIRGNVGGEVFAILDRFNPSPLAGHYLLHPTYMCDDDSRCFSTRDRGEDITHRQELREFGTIARDTRLVVLKDMPTERQEGFRDVIFSSAVSAAGTVFGSMVAEFIRGAVNR